MEKQIISRKDQEKDQRVSTELTIMVERLNPPSRAQTEDQVLETCDRMSLNSTNSLKCTEPEGGLCSKSYQESPISSVRITNSPVNKDPKPLTFTWPKLKQPNLSSHVQEVGDLSENTTMAGSCSDEMMVARQTIQETADQVMEAHLPHLSQEMMNQGRNVNCAHQTCPGTIDLGKLPFHKTLVAPSQQLSSKSSTVTSNQPNCISNSPQELQEESRLPSGSISSKVKRSTSTKSSRRYTALLLIRRERLALEIQRLALQRLTQKGRLRQALNGLPRGDPLRERLLLSSNIETESYRNMGTISRGFLPQRNRRPMAKSFFSTEESGMRSEGDNPSCSQTTPISPPYMPQHYRMMGSNITEGGGQEGEKEDLEEEVRNPRSALGTTARPVVGSQIQDVNTCTPASCVEKEVMASTFVASEDELFGMRPKYLRYNLWDEGCVPKMTVAEWTHTAHPLPSLPAYELQNEPACKTVLERPDLFVIVTPIKVEVLESLLNSHPNHPFVESVLNGLREGFWPWVNTMLPGYLLTHDESRPLVLSEEKKDFVANQLKHERDLGRVSSDFGETLLPGMDCMPHYVVPKPHSTNWRLVNDLSAGPYSLNGMVEHDEVIGYPLDNLSHLGDLLLRKRRENPSLSFVAWKSDIAEAYRMCPMHKLWQLKQVVRIEKKLCVDRVNMFGGSYSQAIFTSVNALVAWVAKVERAIEALVYVDDSFGIDEEGNLVWYGPYGKYYPEQQTRLLQLWDKIGIPHKETKQVFGSQLTILGIEVNTIDLTFTLTQESKEQLEAELLAWCQRGVRKKVKEWQRLAGWVNWVLNVYPYLRPALNNIYAKLKGKGQEMRIWANNAIREDLMWAKGIVQRSDGIRLLSAASWDINEATCVAMTDTCPRGLGFWYPNLNLCFASSTPTGTLSTEITFFEALAVLSALYDAVHRFPPKTRMVIFTDNFASVAMFSTFRALPEYNCILRAAVDLILEAKFDLRVVHISGDQNDVADALSRGDFMRALQSHPNLSIHSFEPYQRVDRHQSPPLLRPPRNMLGAAVI